MAGFLAVALAAGAMAGAVTGWAIGASDDEPAASAAPTPPAEVTTVVLDRPVDPVDDEAMDVAAVAARVMPSIVRVGVFEEVPQDELDTLCETPNDAGEFPSVCEDGLAEVGTGSGVGFTAEGHILTNNHVVEDAARIEVELVDGRTYPAELVGRDELTDVAVIKVQPGLVEPIPLADRASLGIGDTAIAVGNPLGLVGGPSVSVGIISAFERELEIDRPGGTRRLQGLIQTDAAISGGSSGGALVDRDGALIGITTAKSVGGTTEGVGFAVPVDLVVNIGLDLISFGSIDHPFLGILGRTHYETLADGGEAPRGAEVIQVLDGTVEDSPVEVSAFGLAGAEPGDVIVEFDGVEIGNMNQLGSLLRRYRAGQEVEVAVQRADERVILDVVLGSRPDGT
jgi:serine protease Do